MADEGSILDARTREDTADGIAALVRWAAGMRTRAIPAAVNERAARVLADDLAAIVGARDEPEVAAFHARTLARAGAPEATVFRGGRARVDRRSAAVANAVAGDWLELDEGYRVTPCHAGLYVLPALLAEAEARDLPVRELLRILAVSYEVVTRVARAFAPRALVVHSHARYAAVGASCATGLAAGVEADVLHAALTMAATLVNAGPRNHLVSGALARNVWPAVGAWSGMMSVEWAQCGIAGATDGFADVYAGVFDSNVRPQALTAGLGETWAISDGYTKVYACCQHLHSAVEAALELRPRLMAQGGPDAIEAIDVDAHALAQLLPNPRPTTTLGAKFSLPHAVAATLVTGTGGAEAFASNTVAAPRIAALRQRVAIHPYAAPAPPPNDRPARVRVRLRDGGTIESECASAQGGPDRPFSLAVLDDKIRALTAAAYPRLPATMAALVALDDALLDRRWASVVTDFCA